MLTPFGGVWTEPVEVLRIPIIDMFVFWLPFVSAQDPDYWNVYISVIVNMSAYRGGGGWGLSFGGVGG